jgi:hypothetical protein
LLRRGGTDELVTQSPDYHKELQVESLTMKTFSSVADAFAYSEQLAKGQLRSFEGTIKRADTPDLVLFNPLNCGSWISIVATSITEIRFLGTRQSGVGEKSDTWPYVQLYIRTEGLQESAYLTAIEQLTKKLQHDRRRRSPARRSRSPTRRADGYYATAYIYNQRDLSTDYSTFQVVDNLMDEPVQTVGPLYGGQTGQFQFWFDDISGGDVDVYNITSNDGAQPLHNVQANETYDL